MQKFILAGVAVLSFIHIAQGASPPVAPVRPVITNYYGTPVIDNYRWMETPDSPELAAYMKGQNAYTRAMLDSIPGRATLLKEVSRNLDIVTDTDSLLIADNKYFYLQTQPGQNTGKIYMRDADTGATKLLVDPDKFSKSGGAVAVSYFAPSQDGRYLAYGISLGGSEAATLHVLDTASLKDQGVAIDRIEGDNPDASDAGFLPVAWLPGDSFVYYRMRKLGPKDDPDSFFLKSRFYLHHLGQNPNGDGDVAVFGYGVDKSVPAAANQDALPVIPAGSGYAFGVLTENEEADTIDAIYITPIGALKSGKPVWRKVSSPSDAITAFDAAGGRLYLLTTRNASNGKILETSLANPDIASAKTVLGPSSLVIRAIGAAADGLYASSSKGGYSVINRVTDHGISDINLPYPGDADDLVTQQTAPGAVFSLESWTKPALWFRSDATGAASDTGIQKLPPIDLSNLVSKEVMATSYDGTQVPLSIIMLRGTQLNGKNPTLLEGYGAYGITLTPYFRPGRLALLDRGGIIAFAHVRGGGWFGEAWHQAGMKLTKLNTVFDFIACAQYLEDNHYTSPAYLAGEGGSAGGITIGGAIDWAPQLFAAAIDSHGETDNLRSEFTPNGPPNIIEFGSVTTEPGFHGLYAMSAYAHVRDGTAYPAVLLQTGINDPRVAPWEVAKMAARLQAATSSKKPILLSVDYDSGHGMGDTKAQDAAEWADELSFIFWQTGNPDFQPK
jgi:prolyl oligopeptidase